MSDQLFFFLCYFAAINALLGLGVIVEGAFFRNMTFRKKADEENELQNWWVQQDQDDQWIDENCQ